MRVADFRNGELDGRSRNTCHAARVLDLRLKLLATKGPIISAVAEIIGPIIF